jgi:hypothetical protein
MLSIDFIVIFQLALLLTPPASKFSQDPESYAGGSVATGRFTHAGQVKG